MPGGPAALVQHCSDIGFDVTATIIAQAVVGVLTVLAAFYAARVGASGTAEATEQRATAAAHEEFGRRLQWATSLALDETSARTRAVGAALLEQLLTSPLASPDDIQLCLQVGVALSTHPTPSA